MKQFLNDFVLFYCIGIGIRAFECRNQSIDLRYTLDFVVNTFFATCFAMLFYNFFTIAIWLRKKIKSTYQSWCRKFSSACEPDRPFMLYSEQADLEYQRDNDFYNDFYDDYT